MVTTPSRFLLEQMERYRPDLYLLPNPLDLRAYTARSRTHALPNLVWLRSFHAIYNPTMAPRVLARLAEQYPAAHLWMVGPDKHDGSLVATQQVAEELGVTERVTIPGGVPKADISAWMQRGDIFLNTTNTDNTPISVLEAMACGLCVVSTNVGGIPYLVRHEYDALLVPPDDADAMTAAVQRLLNDPDLAARISVQAQHSAQQFDWSIILPQWEHLFAQVLHTEGL
jgi:glycosyltransferase involved in cell wall biosynthesis